MIEEWRDVVGWEGLYQVSNFGRVKSLSKLTWGRCQGGERFKKYTKEKFPTVFLTKKGYPQTTLCFNNMHKTKVIHRLVVEAFHPDFKKELQVDHIDMNKENNHIDNLDMVTNLENLRRSHAYGSHSKTSVKMKSRARVLTNAQAKLIKEMYWYDLNKTKRPNQTKPFGQRWLAKCFRCSQNTINHIVNNKSCYDRSI